MIRRLYSLIKCLKKKELDCRRVDRMQCSATGPKVESRKFLALWIQEDPLELEQTRRRRPKIITRDMKRRSDPAIDPKRPVHFHQIVGDRLGNASSLEEDSLLRWTRDETIDDMWARKALAFEELFYFVSEKPQLQNSESRFRSKSEENIRLKKVCIYSRIFTFASPFWTESTMAKSFPR